MGPHTHTPPSVDHLLPLSHQRNQIIRKGEKISACRSYSYVLFHFSLCMVIELLFGLVEAVFVAPRSEELGIAT